METSKSANDNFGGVESVEGSLEKFPSYEEVVAALEQYLDGAEYTIEGEPQFNDKGELVFMRVAVVGKELTYQRGTETCLDEVYLDADGVPEGGRPLAKWNSETAEWIPE